MASTSIRQVLITGGRGQLGGELQRLLQRAGVSFEALDLPELDVTDERAVLAAVQRTVELAARAGDAGGGPGALVIHAAAFTAVDRAEEPGQRELATRVNVDGTRAVARACAAAGVPLVYVSTDFVFGGDKRLPYEVDDEPCPLSVYGATKLAGEEAVREVCPQHYIVRTAWVYGVYGHNFPRTILGAAAKAMAEASLPALGQPKASTAALAAPDSPRSLRVVNDQVGCPTYARDLAEAILLLAGVPVVQPEGVKLLPQTSSSLAPASSTSVTTTPCLPGGAAYGVVTPPAPAPFGTYHVTNVGSCSWYGFACEIVRLAGWPVPVQPISSAELNRPARRPAYSVLSPAKLRSVGFELRPWPQALAAFMAELRTDSPDLFPQ